jgi:spore coat protein U-like protein
MTLSILDFSRLNFRPLGFLENIMRKLTSPFVSFWISVAGTALWVVPAAQAATTTTTFPVTATVLKACFVSATALSFGNYDPTATVPLDSTATLTVLCTVGTSFTVGLNAGTVSGGTVTTRRMTSGANTLGYGLFQDTGRATNWGSTPGTDTPAAITAPIAASSLTVFGRVVAGQNVPTNTYTDTITVTVNY